MPLGGSLCMSEKVARELGMFGTEKGGSMSVPPPQSPWFARFFA